MESADVVERYRGLLARLLPSGEPGRLEVRAGQFHHVVIGPDRVVCLPRTEAAAARLPRRVAVLRALSELDLRFRTPEPLVESGPSRDGPAFLVLSRIPGAPLPEGALHDPTVAESVASQYVDLLASFAAAGADRRLRAALEAVRPGRWQRFAADVRLELFPLMSAVGRRRAERELDALDRLPHSTAALVHGDLGAENVHWEITNEGPRLGGVVDWDEAALGDPAEDLAAIGAGHGQDLLARVLASGYRSDRGITDRVAAIAGTFALQQALYAHRDGDRDGLADGLSGYR